jgi:thiol:disulfide interchange protein DsbD
MALALVARISSACISTPSPADPPTPTPPKHVSAALICDQASLTPGSMATLGLDFSIEKGWHIYSNGRNDNGVPPTADFELPAGFTVDAIQWPAPIRHIEPGDMLNHVYADHATLLVPLHIPADAHPGSTVVIKAKLSWLVCDRICVTEDADVRLSLPIAKPGESSGKSPDAGKFDLARARMPQDLTPGSPDISITWTNKSVALSVPGATSLSFYPDEDCVPFASPIKDADAAGSTLAIGLGDPEPGHASLAGVLELRRGKLASGLTSPRFYRIRSSPPAKLPSAKPVPPTTPTTPPSSP